MDHIESSSMDSKQREYGRTIQFSTVRFGGRGPNERKSDRSDRKYLTQFPGCDNLIPKMKLILFV
jgi:hypothetical protein